MDFFRIGNFAVKEAILRIMVDQPLNDLNRISISRMPHGLYNCKIRLCMDESTKICANRLERTFIETLSKSEYVDSINTFSEAKEDSGLKIRASEDTEWKDAAHYFGTVPMNKLFSSAHINESCALNGFINCYVVGNSALPIGSHGHPTLLNMCLSHLCASTVNNNG